MTGWKPSTSFSGATAYVTRVSSTCAREGQLHEDAVHLLVVVQLRDEREHVCLGRVRRQAHVARLDARLRRRLVLGADVDVRRRVVADEHGCEPDVTELLDVACHRPRARARRAPSRPSSWQSRRDSTGPEARRPENRPPAGVKPRRRVPMIFSGTDSPTLDPKAPPWCSSRSESLSRHRRPDVRSPEHSGGSSVPGSLGCASGGHAVRPAGRQVVVVHRGRGDGFKNLERDHCENKGVIGHTQLWYCPTPIGRP